MRRSPDSSQYFCVRCFRRTAPGHIRRRLLVLNELGIAILTVVGIGVVRGLNRDPARTQETP